MNALEQKIEQIIAPSLAGLGYALVRVQLTDGARRKLQIMAELADGANVTLDDCAKISRTVSALLDVADPIPDEYTLEVSSPGIDRPLVRLNDYTRFAGFTAKLQVLLPIDGRRRFQGVVTGVEGEEIILKLPDSPEPVRIAYTNVDSAKLVLTKELIDFTQKPSVA